MAGPRRRISRSADEGRSVLLVQPFLREAVTSSLAFAFRVPLPRDDLAVDLSAALRERDVGR
jgi:hypothetical protein